MRGRAPGEGPPLLSIEHLAAFGEVLHAQTRRIGAALDEHAFAFGQFDSQDGADCRRLDDSTDAVAAAEGPRGFVGAEMAEHPGAFEQDKQPRKCVGQLAGVVLLNADSSHHGPGQLLEVLELDGLGRRQQCRQHPAD